MNEPLNELVNTLTRGQCEQKLVDLSVVFRRVDTNSDKAWAAHEAAMAVEYRLLNLVRAEAERRQFELIVEPELEFKYKSKAEYDAAQEEGNKI